MVNLFEIFPITSFEIDALFSLSPPLLEERSETVKVKLIYRHPSPLSSNFLEA